MGKKGPSSSSSSKPPANVAVPAAAAAEGAAPGRKARGHRQKGAGTVIVAKPPEVTTDGIVLAPHMRLPSVLVREYCQREKRPAPIYGQEGPNRMALLLRDAKNAKDDLRFCPVQSFESPTQAREYAALLALHHLQPSLPLERKLPEPFSHTWLDMTRSSSKATSATAAGRNKKEEDKKLSTSATDKPVPSTAGQAVARPPAACKDFTATANPIVGKAAPAPVLGLRATSQFASKSAKSQSNLAEVSASARKRAYFDAVRRANKPESVFMGARLRVLIEQALGVQKMKAMDEDVIEDDSAVHRDITDIQTLCHRVATDGGSAASVLSILSSHLTPAALRDLPERIYAELAGKRHFRPDAVLHALAMLLLGAGPSHAGGSPSAAAGDQLGDELRRCLEFLDQDSTEKDQALPASNAPSATARLTASAKESVARGLCRDQCLEYLCLHMEEDDLPEVKWDLF